MISADSGLCSLFFRVIVTLEINSKKHKQSSVRSCTCGSHVEGVEALSRRRHQVELPVLRVVPERVRHVVGVETQDPETGEQGAAAGRHLPASGHTGTMKRSLETNTRGGGPEMSPTRKRSRQCEGSA